MVLVAAPLPRFAASNEGELTVEERKKRKVWKCPVGGCHFVAEQDRTEEAPTRRLCRVCGRDLGGNHYGHRVCRACYNARANDRNRQIRARTPKPRKVHTFEIRLSGARAGQPQPQDHPWRTV